MLVLEKVTFEKNGTIYHRLTVNQMRFFMPSHSALLFLICLTACAPIAPIPATAQPAFPSKEESSTQLPPQGDPPDMSPVPFTPNLQALIEKATDDLSQRLSVEKSYIQILDAREVVWPNSSLGCPQPGMLYTEVLTPGFLILLENDGNEYEYHAGKSSDVFLCDTPAPPVPGLSGET